MINIEKEIERACKRENPNWDGESFDYGCACYKNAGDAAKAAYAELEKGEHSGFSWSITVGVLKRLLDGLPLTAITKDDFDGGDSYGAPEEEITTQCPRYSSLFRSKTPDGDIYYRDIDRAICFDVDNPTDKWSGGMTSIVDELFPIALPYYPSARPYQVAVEECLYDEALGDFDMYKIHYILKPDGSIVHVNACYREKIDHWYRWSDSDHVHAASTGFQPISDAEFQKLKTERIKSEYKEGDPLEIRQAPSSEKACDCVGGCECCDCAG